MITWTIVKFYCVACCLLSVNVHRGQNTRPTRAMAIRSDVNLSRRRRQITDSVAWFIIVSFKRHVSLCIQTPNKRNECSITFEGQEPSRTTRLHGAGSLLFDDWGTYRRAAKWKMAHCHMFSRCQPPIRHLIPMHAALTEYHNAIEIYSGRDAI